MNVSLRTHSRWAACSAFVALLACFGASSGSGAITFTRLAAFSGTNGARPLAGFALAADGSFYGTTVAGGANGQGTVFRFTPGTNAGGLTNLLDFDGANGAQPFAPLLQGTNGNFYGTTSAGGASGNGTVFEMTLDGGVVRAVSFDGANTGAQAAGGLVQAADRTLYGATMGGGAGGKGTIFSFTPAGTFRGLVSFYGTNGAAPLGRLALSRSSTNLFYGTTSAGGQFNAGTIFSMRTGVTPVLSTLYSFTGGTDGAGPQAGLTLGSDGNFYGTTAGGGESGLGSVFQFKPGGATNALTTLVSFSGTNGASPFAPLMQADDGNLYGTTFSGGAYNHGTAFRLATDGTFETLYSFRGGSDGAAPYYAGLVQGTDGNRYGTASAGGVGGRGTLYMLSGFAPFIITSPGSQTVSRGQTVTFSVSAGGSAILSFRWLLNSNHLADTFRISGVTTSTLTLSNVTATDAGTYTVLVQNSVGSITSSGAALFVIEPPTVRITSPAPNSLLNAPIITVKGVTTDNVSVARVAYQWNGGGWQLATPLSGWSKWSAENLVVMTGTNTLQVYAVNSTGLVSPTNTVTFLSGTSNPLQPVSGAYSGYLQIGRHRFKTSGQFDLNGIASSTVDRGDALPALTVSLQLDLSDDHTDQITGTVSDGNWAADFMGDRAVPGATNAGRYTMIIPGDSESDMVPNGDGYGAVKVDAAGRLSLSGSLADGTKISQSARVSRNRQWPLYVPLYSGKGSLLSWMTFAKTDANDLSGLLNWIKPELKSAKYYPGGFTNQIEAWGARYTPPAKGSPLLPFATGELLLTGGDLAEPLISQLVIGANNRVTSTNNTSLSFSLGSGIFKGKVFNGTGKPISFSGVVLTNVDQGRGYFLGPTRSGQVLLESGE